MSVTIDVPARFQSFAGLRPAEHRARLFRDVDELQKKYRIPDFAAENMRQCACPDDDAVTGGDYMLALEDVGACNENFAVSVAKVMGKFTAGKVTKIFAQVERISSFGAAWTEPRVVSAVMGIPMVRVLSTGDFYIGLARKRAQSMGWYWKGGGGYGTNKKPGTRRGFEACLPSLRRIRDELRMVNAFQLAAKGELKEELIGPAVGSAKWVVLTGVYPQEFCHSSEIYGSSAVGMDVKDLSALRLLQGDDPDIDQGKTFWFKVHRRSETEPLSVALTRFARTLGTGPDFTPPSMRDIQTSTAIDNLAAVMEHEEEQGDPTVDVWEKLCAPWRQYDGIPSWVWDTEG